MATRRREKKKKSNNGLLVGSAISAGIVILIALAFYLKNQPGPPDSLSGAITDDNLAKQTLKTGGLPDLGNAPGGSGSLADLLKEVNAIENFITAGGPEPEEKVEKAKPVIQALHGTAATGIPANALDAKVPPKYFESHDLRDDLAALGAAVRITITYLNEQAQFDEAQGIALSYLKLGQQVYEKNTRFKIRQRGLAIMKVALRHLNTINHARYEDGEIEKEAMTAMKDKVAEWDKAIQALEKVWNNKLEKIDSVSSPNIADIIKVAKEDKDISFRIFATLRLGYAKYERGDLGNQKAIEQAIEELKSDSDKLVAKAAAEAESIEREEYHELRK